MGLSAQLQVFQKFGAIGYSILSNTSKCSNCHLWTIGVSISGPSSPVDCKPGTLPSSLHEQWVFDALISWGKYLGILGLTLQAACLGILAGPFFMYLRGFLFMSNVITWVYV